MPALQLNEAGLSQSTRNKTLHTYRLLLLVLVVRPLGNLSLAWGTHHFPRTLAFNPLTYLEAMSNPFIAGGILLLMFALFIRLAMLSLADLSYVLPVTSSGYIFSTLLGKYFLGEQVSGYRWLGVLLIFLGTGFVGTTAPSTTEGRVFE